MGFNEAQREAITFGTGPCQVLAGPGSGKTLTIVNRIRYLIEDCCVKPEEILVVTFTRFAAAEMKNRLCSLMKRREVPVTAGTFHGIFYGIIRWAYRIGSENIMSQDEKYRLLQSVLSGQNTDFPEEEDFLRDLSEEIGTIKNNGTSVDEYESSVCGPETFRDIYRDYEAKRKSLRKLDFDDMLVVCRDLFLSRPDILKQWQNKFRYILIDEFQDINRVQYDVIRMLALPEDNLFVVGDDDQAIYGFRGADPELMFRFVRDYPGAKQIVLGQNYRSTKNIVDNSLRVIGYNKKRFPKKLETSNRTGPNVHVQELRDQNEQAVYIADEIVKRSEAGVEPEETAVLFRVHTDARPVMEELVRRKIPFRMKEHIPNLYDHFIAKDILAYLRLASGEKRRSDFLQIMNKPGRYIGRDSISSDGDFFVSAREFYRDREWMADRIDQFEWDIKMLSGMAPYAGIEYIRKKIGYDGYIKDYAYTHKIDQAVLKDVLLELEESSKPYSSFDEWQQNIRQYTDRLREAERKKTQEGNGIRLMTIHAAKGLEFNTVFLIDANEGSIPYKKASTEKETEEERRLFYVAMTRAKEVLKISYVKKKNGKDADPSRFVEELLGGADR